MPLNRLRRACRAPATIWRFRPRCWTYSNTIQRSCPALHAQHPDSEPRSLCVLSDGCAASAESCSSVASIDETASGRTLIHLRRSARTRRTEQLSSQDDASRTKSAAVAGRHLPALNSCRASITAAAIRSRPLSARRRLKIATSSAWEFGSSCSAASSTDSKAADWFTLPKVQQGIPVSAVQSSATAPAEHYRSEVDVVAVVPADIATGA